MCFFFGRKHNAKSRGADVIAFGLTELLIRSSGKKDSAAH